MKVLFLSNIPTPNQLDFVQETNNYLNMQYIVLYPTEAGRDWNLDQIPNMKILYFKKKLSNYISYYKLYKEFDPDILLVGGYSIPLSLFSYIFTKKDNKKFLFWLEKPNKTTKFKTKLKHMYMKIKFTLIRPDAIIAIGQKTSDFYKIYFKRVENFPYSMNLNNYYSADRINNINKIKFLFCGQLINRKNILNVLKAFSEIDNDQIELNILGSGELKYMVEQYAEKDKRTTLLGFIQPKNIYKIYQENDVFLLPSLDDGWALVINEAMASAMPIIGTSEVGAIEEFIEHKENGYICDADTESIKRGMEFYIDNSNLIYRHGMKNREIIKSSLADVKKSAPEFEAFIESLY